MEREKKIQLPFVMGVLADCQESRPSPGAVAFRSFSTSTSTTSIRG